MSLMSMLDQAQGGRLFTFVARSLDLDEAQTRKAMGKLCPAIAERLQAKAMKADALCQSLLALMSDTGAATPLESGEALTGREGLSDGNAILDDVFGSRTVAMATLRAVDPSIPDRELMKLAPISATAVVAALAEANRPMALAAEPAAAAAPASGQGFFGALVAALIAGIVSALTRRLGASTRRRGTTTSYSRARRRTATSGRRSTNASVEDIFRDILGNLGK